MNNPALVVTASSLIAATIVIIWFHAPVAPVLAGAMGAGLLLHRRGRRSLARSRSR